MSNWEINNIISNWENINSLILLWGSELFIILHALFFLSFPISINRSVAQVKKWMGWSFTTVFAVYLNFLLCAQVAKHQMYHKQINLSQSWRIGSRSGRKNRKRMNQKTCQEHQLINLFTPSHLDFLPHKCSHLPYYHHHQGGTLIYQELTGAKDRGGAVSPW